MTTYTPPPAVLTLQAAHALDTTYMDPSDVAWSCPGGYFELPTPMFLQASQTSFLFSPISTFAKVYNARAGYTAEWALDGDVVGTSVVGTDRIASLTVTSGLLAAGWHIISCKVDGVTVRRAIRVIRNPNVPLTPALADKPPRIVPEAIVDGRYRWVLQDLAFGGIGSWVMPRNPISMDPLPKHKALLVATTTSVSSGKNHVTEGHPAPQSWSFKGYCPDQVFYEKLKSYGDLNRRFYLIDHRNRAWNVTFERVQMVPRKRQQLDTGRYNDWAHDYTVQAVIYDQQPKTPE